MKTNYIRNWTYFFETIEKSLGIPCYQMWLGKSNKPRFFIQYIFPNKENPKFYRFTSPCFCVVIYIQEEKNQLYFINTSILSIFSEIL